MVDARGFFGMVAGVVLSVVAAVLIFLLLRYTPLLAVALGSMAGVAIVVLLVLVILGLLHYFGFFYYLTRREKFGDSSTTYSLDQSADRREQ